jgi:hypothetical protein
MRAALAPFLLITGCVGSQPTTKVAADRITGNWVGPHGKKLTFGTDRTFTANGLDSKNLAVTRCPGKSSEGGWSFYVAEGHGTEIGEKTAKSGSWIGLSFHGAAENCHFDLAVVDGGKTLCDGRPGLFVRTGREVHQGVVAVRLTS